MKKGIIKFVSCILILVFVATLLTFVKIVLLRPHHSDTLAHKVLHVPFKRNKERKKSEQIVVTDKKVIKDVEISGDGIGILVKAGAEAIVENVHLHHNVKGMYIEKGAKVRITNSIVEDNVEEGIDIREFTRVLVMDNLIRNNGESGVEMESEGVKVYVIGNEIVDNYTHGVTTQYRTGEGGKTFIISNDIKNNRKDDLFCNNTVGAAKTPKLFYCDFISFYGDIGKVKGCKWTQCKKTVISF